MPRIPFTAFAAGARGTGGPGTAGPAALTGATGGAGAGTGPPAGRIPFTAFAAQRQPSGQGGVNVTGAGAGTGTIVVPAPAVTPATTETGPPPGGQPTSPPVPPVNPLPGAGAAADLDLARTLADIRGDAGLIGAGTSLLGTLVGGDTGTRISGAGGLLSPFTNAVDAIVNETRPDEQRILGGIEAATEIVPPLGRLVAGSEVPPGLAPSADVIAGLLDIGQAIAADENDAQQAIDAGRGGVQVAGGLDALGAFGTPGASSTLGPLTGAEEAGELALGASGGSGSIPYAQAALLALKLAETAMDDEGTRGDEQKAVNALLDVGGAAGYIFGPAAGMTTTLAADVVRNLLATHLFTHEPSHEEREMAEWGRTGGTARELLASIRAAETPERLQQVLDLAARGAATGDPLAVITRLGDRASSDYEPADFLAAMKATPGAFSADVQAGIEHGKKQPINRAVEHAVRQQATILRTLVPLVEPIRAETGYPDLTLGDILAAFRERPGTPDDFRRQVLAAREDRLVRDVIFPMVRDWDGQVPERQKWYTDPAAIPDIAAEFRVPEERVAGIWRTGGTPQPPSSAEMIANLETGGWVLDDNGNLVWRPYGPPVID